MIFHLLDAVPEAVLGSSQAVQFYKIWVNNFFSAFSKNNDFIYCQDIATIIHKNYLSIKNFRMMTKENAESLRAEAESYIGLRYFVLINAIPTEYVFVAAKVNTEERQFFPVALLRPVITENNIEVELIKVIEYFRQTENR